MSDTELVLLWLAATVVGVIIGLVLSAIITRKGWL